MTLLVEKLETLDKNNVLAVRQEIAILKKKLKECEDSKVEDVPVALPHPPPGKHTIFLSLEPGLQKPRSGWEGIQDCNPGARMDILTF